MYVKIKIELMKRLTMYNLLIFKIHISLLDRSVSTQYIGIHLFLPCYSWYGQKWKIITYKPLKVNSLGLYYLFTKNI
jgi:hypothetical protein